MTRIDPFRGIRDLEKGLESWGVPHGLVVAIGHFAMQDAHRKRKNRDEAIEEVRQRWLALMKAERDYLTEWIEGVERWGPPA